MRTFKSQKTATLFFLYLLLGMSVRWFYWSSKDPEAFIDYGAFAETALRMQHPYDTGMRSPLWPWVLKLWWFITNTKVETSFTYPEHSFYVSQTLGFIWFPFILFMSMKFCEDYFGKWQSWIVGWLLSVSNYQVCHEFLALREPLESILVLWLLFMLIPTKESLSLAKTLKIRLTIVSSLLILTRDTYLQVLFILLPIFFLLNQWKLRYFLVVWGIGFILIQPHYYVNRVKHSDSTFQANLLLGEQWWRDFEHRKGFPRNWEEWRQTNFNPGQKTITISEYLFKYHRWWQIPSILFFGIYNFFFYHGNVTGLLIWRYPLENVVKKMLPFHILVMFFYLAGYFSILSVEGRRRFIAFMFLIMMPYYLIGHIQVILRYAFPVAPLFLMILAQGMVSTITEIYPRIIGTFKT